MATIGTISIGMAVNTKDFTAKLKAAQSHVGRFATSAESLKGVLAGLAGAFAVNQVATGLFDVAKSGANLNAILSKTGVIFGDSAKIITGEANNVAASVGGIKSEFVDAATSFGSVFKGLGKSEADAAKLGVSLTKLGMDLASFEGVANEEAFTAISSALRGEFDPIEKFRVFLSADKIATEALATGLAKTKTEIDDYAKKTATLSLILRQTSDAQGDLSRTAGDADNQIKAISGRFTNLKDEAGMAIRPITESISQLANTTLIQLEQAITANKDAVTAWAADAASSNGAVFEGFGRIGAAVGLVADSIQVLNLVIQMGQTLILNLEAIAVSAFVNINKWVDKALSKITGVKPDDFDSWDAFADSLNSSATQANAGLSEAIKAPWASEKITGMFDKIKDSAAGMASGVAESTKKMADSTASAAADMTKKIQSLESNLKAQLATFGMDGHAAEIYKLKLAGATDAQLALAKSLDTKVRANEIIEQTRTPVEKYAEELKKLKALRGAGAITPEVFRRADLAAKKDSGLGDNRLGGAGLEMGSGEAISAINQFKFGNGADNPMAKKADRQITLAEQMARSLEELVRRAGGKLGTAVGTATAPVFAQFQ